MLTRPRYVCFRFYGCDVLGQLWKSTRLDMSAQLFPFIACSLARPIASPWLVQNQSSFGYHVSWQLSPKKACLCVKRHWGKYFFGLVFNDHWSWTFLPHPCINLSVTSTEPPELYLEKSHSYCMTCVCFVEMQSCPTCFKIFYICFGGVQLLYVHGTHKNIWPSSLPALFRRQHQPTERQDHQYFFRLKKRRTKQGDGVSTVSTNHKMTLSKSERDMGCFIIWKCK